MDHHVPMITLPLLLKGKMVKKSDGIQGNAV